MPPGARAGWVRFALGMAQMNGAMLGLILLVTLGLHPATVLIVAITTALSITCRIVYRRRG